MLLALGALGRREGQGIQEEEDWGCSVIHCTEQVSKYYMFII